MKLRTYEEVQEVLAENISKPIKQHKYKFFRELERAVYGFDLNAKAGLPTSNPYEFRETWDLPRPSEKMIELTEEQDSIGTWRKYKKEKIKMIPYWEIHYFEEGFTTNTVDEKEADQWFSKTDIQDHFYFTLRSKITNYDSLNITTRSNNHLKSFHAGKDSCKIKNDFTGQSKDQPEGFDIYILEDDQDNFDFLKTIISGDIWNCLSYKGEILKCKPSELPQMLFLTYGSTFIAKTENVESIVCMDRFTNLSTNELENILALKGNTFLNHSSIVSPTRYGNDSDSYLGKNTVFGHSCMVRSVYVEDHVVVANEVDIDIETYLKSGCIITEGTKITAHQKILPGQKVAAKMPLFLNLLNDSRGLFLDDFFRVSKIRRERT